MAVLTGRALAAAMARRFAERNMVARVRITRLGAPVLDPVTGVLDAAAPELVYEGIGRVSLVSGPVTMSLGDEPQYFSGSSVSIPVEVDGVHAVPRVDDVVEVLEHPDSLVVGLSFRVMDVETGGHMIAARRMQVTGAQRAKTWRVP